jgi:hypothetical protein
MVRTDHWSEADRGDLFGRRPLDSHYNIIMGRRTGPERGARPTDNETTSPLSNISGENANLEQASEKCQNFYRCTMLPTARTKSLPRDSNQFRNDLNFPLCNSQTATDAVNLSVL